MERANKRTVATHRTVAKDIISCVFALLECTDDELDYLGFITDEQLALNSELDLEKLKLEIDSLSGLEFNLDILGFDDTFMLELNFDADELDYSMLEDDEADESANEIASAGKKAIQIEFDIRN